MDLKQRKPVHLRCPQCGHDFAVNTNRIEEDYALMKAKATRIKADIAALNDRNVPKNAPERKRLVSLLEDTNAQIVAIKKVRHAMSREMEIQKMTIFRRLVEGILGKEKTYSLLDEAEEEMTFREYDMAVQRHNNFDGA